ncbi:MAG: YhcH/YjgK/YiaL family protein [Bacteroidaceae bacterium]|nr:YhcH/YjgK/YiaL family protein [Bacteroidaceae bacterium]
MILDSLENLKNYVSLNPNFEKVVEFIANNKLADLPLGRNEIMGDAVFANVMEVKPRTKDEAPLEIHRRYIDIQIPISADELMGYTPLAELPAPDYIEADDYALYPVGMEARDYFNVKNDQFVVFFPQDGHAPAITAVPLKKVVFKVAIQ